METKVLQMRFKDNDDKIFGIDLNDPKDDITAENIKQVMDDIILKNIFKRGLNAKIGAQIVTKTVQELVLAQESLRKKPHISEVFYG